MKAAKHYHYFAYSIQMNVSEETKPSKVRDGASFGEMTATLGRLGYEYWQIIFNIPSSSGSEARAEKDQFSFVKPDDLIVLTTRPPLDDRRHKERKHMDGSSTHLEQQILWTSFRWTSCLNTRLKTEGRECFRSWSLPEKEPAQGRVRASAPTRAAGSPGRHHAPDAWADG